MVTPGEIIPAEGPGIEINAGRRRAHLVVRNTGDRAVQVGSHYHFFEANRALEFDRARALGMRLDIPAGTAIRFEPGAEQEVTLVPFAGTQRIVGFANLVGGSINARSTAQAALAAAERLGFRNVNRTTQ